MSAILRLYPRTWRERYGDELAALLADRPASLSDHVDLLRGAVDARLHPQVPGNPAAPVKEIPVNQRLFGVLSAIGGIAWILGIASIFTLPRELDGSRAVGLAIIGVALWTGTVGVALAELGTRGASAASRRTGQATAIASFVLALLMPIVWPIFVFGLFVFPVGAALLAVRGTRNGALPGWIAVAFAAAAFAVLSGVGADVDAGRDQGLIFLSLIGVPGLLLGWHAVRGATVPSPAPPGLDPA